MTTKALAIALLAIALFDLVATSGAIGALVWAVIVGIGAFLVKISIGNGLRI